MNKLYSVHDHWTDINKKNDVDIESINGVITGIKVNGEDYGGNEWQNIYDNTINTVLDSDGFYTTNIGVVIEADSIRVTFDGVEYSCPKRSISEISTNFYGAPTPLESGEEDFDWNDYPFSIRTGSGGTGMIITTQTAGTHTLKIDAPQSGSGESDFSIANVTTINNTLGVIRGITIPTVCEENELGEGSPSMLYNSMDIPVGESTHKVCMYKGLAFCSNVFFIESATVTTSGNVTYEEGEIFITGDCTITIS